MRRKAVGKGLLLQSPSRLLRSQSNCPDEICYWTVQSHIILTQSRIALVVVHIDLIHVQNKLELLIGTSLSKYKMPVKATMIQCKFVFFQIGLPHFANCRKDMFLVLQKKSRIVGNVYFNASPSRNYSNLLTKTLKKGIVSAPRHFQTAFDLQRDIIRFFFYPSSSTVLQKR